MTMPSRPHTRSPPQLFRASASLASASSGSSRRGPICTIVSCLTPASAASSPAVRMLQEVTGLSFMASCESQHITIITSAPRARSTTESHGFVSPVITRLPSSVSIRYASESRKGCT